MFVNFRIFLCILPLLNHGLCISEKVKKTMKPQIALTISKGDLTSVDSIPYQVGIMKHDKFHCGGSIIRHNVIITAAHCTNGTKESDLYVRAGSSYSNHSGQVVSVGKIIQHENYYSSKMNKSTENYMNTSTENYAMYNDISLLKLVDYLTFNDQVKSIALPDRYADFPDGIILSTSGWGLQDPVKKNHAYELRRIYIPLLNKETCKEFYWDDHKIKIENKHICAGAPGKDACFGDSGGPLTASIDDSPVLLGITSFGSTTCNSSDLSNRYGVWTRVTNYLAWINKKMTDVDSTHSEL